MEDSNCHFITRDLTSDKLRQALSSLLMQLAESGLALLEVPFCFAWENHTYPDAKWNNVKDK